MRSRWNWICVLCVGLIRLLAPAAGLAGEVLWVDPAGDPVNATGERLRPFPSIAEALGSQQVSAGGEVKLLAGDYGDILIADANFKVPVLIVAEAGASVHATSVKVQTSSNIVLDGLSVWPLQPANDIELVGTDANSTDIIFRNFDIRGRESADEYPTWNKQEWLDWRYAGVYLRGPSNALESSNITGVGFAVATTGKDARVENTTIRGFSGDAIRGLGDNSVYRGNRISDCVLVDENHADAFQSWSIGPDRKPGTGMVRGLVLDANLIYEWSNPVLSPLRCSLQGIGMFDGPYEGTIVQNNIIVVTAYHGIMIMGAIDSRIVNNTVVNALGPSRKEPWIGVSEHKNKTIKAERNIIANNITHSIMGGSRLSFDGTPLYNLIVVNPSIALVAPGQGDFSPIKNGRADGKATTLFAPFFDFFGNKRGSDPDVGAVEGVD